MKDEEEKWEELRGENEMLTKEKMDLQNKVNMLLQMKAQ